MKKFLDKIREDVKTSTALSPDGKALVSKCARRLIFAASIGKFWEEYDELMADEPDAMDYLVDELLDLTGAKTIKELNKFL